MVGAWLTSLMNSPPAGANLSTLVLIAAAGAAGLRLLNPLVTTCAVIAFVFWAGPVMAPLAPGRVIGEGAMTLFIGGSLAALALWLGGREFRRPSHDRMLDWMVAALPVTTYATFASSVLWYGPVRSAGAGESRLGIITFLTVLGAMMLVTGLRRRRHAPLLGFIGCVACLAVELRVATTLATETWLVVYGLVALVAGVGLERYLRDPRQGFTSAALTPREGPLDLLQTAAAAALAQRTAPEAATPEATVTGGGGRFGGGGASGSF